MTDDCPRRIRTGGSAAAAARRKRRTSLPLLGERGVDQVPMPSVTSTGRARRKLAIGLAVLLTIAAGVVRAAAMPARANSAAQPASAAPGGGAMRTWMAANMAGGFRAASGQVAQIAREYNVIVANPGEFAGSVAAMKAANPNLVFYAYLNGTYSGRGDHYSESWYAHDARGAHVVSKGFGNVLMNPTSSGWIGD